MCVSYDKKRAEEGLTRQYIVIHPFPSTRSRKLVERLLSRLNMSNKHGSEMTTRIASVSPSGKKKFEVFVADSLDDAKMRGGDRDCRTGHTFVGHTGPFDCSIGNIFQDDFMNPGSFTIDSMSPRRGSKALSVLIVDDSIIHRKLTMKTLGGVIDEVMWMCDSAENGETAIQLVRNSMKIPDVIIIDQNMESTGGRMLGHQVVELLRQDSQFDNVVIIGCTGMSELAHRDLLGAGCDAVWSKPMPSREEAQAQIVRFLSQKRYQTVEQSLRDNITHGITRQRQPSGDSYTHNKSSDSVFPVFQQVKIARVSYKPVPWEAVVNCSFDRQRALLQYDSAGDSSCREEHTDEDMSSVQRGMGTLLLGQTSDGGQGGGALDNRQDAEDGPESEAASAPFSAMSGSGGVSGKD